ncbi:MAG: pentapeptide repeat-containing protein [Cyanobacteria bacterium P01_A01_bin.123]
MANPEHLERLKAGFWGWDEWRARNPEIKPDLSGATIWQANLSDANLSDADLSDADLSSADLRDTDLRGADLSRANLSYANLIIADLSNANLNNACLSDANLINAILNCADLNCADLSRAELNMADLRRAELNGANLSDANLSGAELRCANLINAILNGANLRRADLSDANLINAILNGADLNGADLSSAELNMADLSGAQALGANFQGATLTGACIKDWNINSETNLEGVVCEYIYLKRNQQERRPLTGTFKPGEFTKLYQQSRDTIDLIFREGLDWRAFAHSFKQVQVEHAGAQIEVESIENKGDGVVIVKLRSALDADQPQIHAGIMQGYKTRIKDLEGQVERGTQTINRLFESHNRLIESQEAMVKAMAENPKVKQEIGTVYGGVAGNVEGDMNVYTPEQQKTLAEAAQEIQALLEQLSETYPLTEVPAKAEAQIKSNPQLRGRIVGAIKSAGKKAVEKLVEHPAGAIVVAAVDGWEKGK